MKIKFTILFCLLLFTVAEAQQKMQYSQYMQNGFLLNPAVAGMEKYGDLRGGFTKQWSGFDGSPQGQFASYHFRLFEDSTSASGKSLAARGRNNQIINIEEDDEAIEKQKIITGLGFIVSSEGDDVIQNNEFSVAGALHFPLKNKSYLSTGLSLGLRNHRFDPTSVRLIDQYDLSFGTQRQSIYMPNLNLGVLWYTTKYFAGISINQTLNNSYSYDRLEPKPQSSLRPHIFFNAGYKYIVSSNLAIIPSVIARYVFPAPPSLDLNIMADYKDLIRAGISYRNKESIIAIVGVTIGHRISFNYSFDFVTSSLKTYTAGTHGIIVSARMGRKNKTFIPKYFW